jgi:hypothetical protein
MGSKEMVRQFRHARRRTDRQARVLAACSLMVNVARLVWEVIVHH